MKTKFSKRELLNNVEMFQRLAYTPTVQEWLDNKEYERFANKLKTIQSNIRAIKEKSNRTKNILAKLDREERQTNEAEKRAKEILRERKLKQSKSNSNYLPKLGILQYIKIGKDLVLRCFS